MTSIINYLTNLNPHVRDSRITFDEPTHTYTIDGDSSYTSVTTWNHQHFEKFNPHKVIKNMKLGKNWNENNKYFHMNDEEIIESWNNNRDVAASAGTLLHLNIEKFYNNMSVVDNSIEYRYFLNFFNDFPYLKPYRTEWTVFHEELKLAGSIDMLFKSELNDKFYIYDWKRSKEIIKSNSFNKFGNKECINHLPDSNYWHYCLQLNTYKAILESKYNINIEEMYLICIHPNNKNNNYQRIKVVNLTEEIKELFNVRLKQILQNNTL
tara:strand:- start:288 stop:1085 length:798 start_codon:yes stop_codon:yes gene_type:complete